ncbi:hypothetical protein K491DRAFT_357615 [Lophiostoma macrostomum CBS 122681]|uniref:Secreted protein n=1 Tax=Lophiostoma macrostomum CBS 122681 TaxID=1314788 RepID=A0A6A6T9X0_9PLEO|nr:hypothetical protein K491DRAFT_357615 [Lophiostoma macrostomum CBS 122681]
MFTQRCTGSSAIHLQFLSNVVLCLVLNSLCTVCCGIAQGHCSSAATPLVPFSLPSLPRRAGAGDSRREAQSWVTSTLKRQKREGLKCFQCMTRNRACIESGHGNYGVVLVGRGKPRLTACLPGRRPPPTCRSETGNIGCRDVHAFRYACNKNYFSNTCVYEIHTFRLCVCFTVGV